jgi:hypothetical protein
MSLLIVYVLHYNLALQDITHLKFIDVFYVIKKLHIP